MSTEDDIFELLVVARKHQAEIDYCIGENKKLIAILGRIEQIPNAALQAIKDSAKSIFETEMPKSLIERTKPLTDAINAAAKHVESIEKQNTMTLGFTAFVGGVVGGTAVALLAHFMK